MELYDGPLDELRNLICCDSKQNFERRLYDKICKRVKICHMLFAVYKSEKLEKNDALASDLVNKFLYI